MIFRGLTLMCLLVSAAGFITSLRSSGSPICRSRQFLSKMPTEDIKVVKEELARIKEEATQLENQLQSDEENKEVAVKDKVELSGWDNFLVGMGFKEDPNEDEENKMTPIEKVKSAGLAGALSYGAFELLFWVVSTPLAILAYHQTTGEWPDLSSAEGKGKVLALTTGFLTFARLAVPFRIATALALTPAMDKYVVQKYFSKKNDSEEK
uniref:DUF1279 domain-containing protein n=1 Tax=Fibrocapsa japonica TaxID=94617 RepID=A0A7S2USK8_9STRA|eukprot:CAMPEP_0113943402 /NCGR_PEP_ID=MMETSP1339-20121228/23245_1 /TAXON_ID=94617 /ORGANISM="Fibrocapsa japonica" /LENGTH=208 /DNA_ID=CAMNT_0000948261 /DNA_START=61 /DNA_END=687 /DNA_ORIENTATION=+ /assembly_acc=CAM_ASM_000762